MSPRHSTSAGFKAVANRRKARRQVATPQTQARRGASLTIVREGTPAQVRELLASLEASGDIGPYEDIIQDEVSVDEALLEMDADLDLADEDEPAGDEWDEGAGTPGDGTDGEARDQASPFAPERFELVVVDGVCSVPTEDWQVRAARSPRGQQVLYELESRLWALKRIAAWLTDRRAAFLHSRDLWDLGAYALTELKDGVIPVVQKSFLRCADLDSRVNEASLSRYIRATDISWHSGSGPLDVLFSDGARRAWVANAVKQFVEGAGEKVSAAMLDEYASLTVSRGSEGRRRLARISAAATDLPTFIKQANMLAGTRWPEVIAHCRDRLLGRADDL